MKALIQRVKRAWVKCENEIVIDIDRGLLILLGVQKGDSKEMACRLADRCSALRIFEDSQGKMNYSLIDIKGEALVVSQFTLLADTKRGNRPSFIDAEEPERASSLYARFINQMEENTIPTKSGIFGARMIVGIENDGPVTIMLES